MSARSSPFFSNSLSIRQEIDRFESVHPSIYAIYDLIEALNDHIVAQQVREHVVCIEGESCAELLCELCPPFFAVLAAGAFRGFRTEVCAGFFFAENPVV